MNTKIINIDKDNIDGEALKEKMVREIKREMFMKRPTKKS